MFDHSPTPAKESPMPAKKPTPKAVTLEALADSRSNIYNVDPDLLVLVTDKSHPLYDERVHNHPDADMVGSIIEHGVIDPIEVRKNGDEYEVASGRQRTINAREANRKLKAAGKPTIKVPVILKRGDDVTMMSVNATANTHRLAETALGIAQKAARMIDNGGMKAVDVARQFKITTAELSQHLKLLDCSTKVIKLVDSGQLAVATAARLSNLDRKEQDKQVDELKSTVGLNRNTVRNVVKAAREAKATGSATQVIQAPKRSVIVAVCDAYSKSTATVQPHLLLAWSLTGAHADELPGPVTGQTLAQWLVGFHAQAGGAKA